MLDPLTALSLAGNVIQFIEFSTTLVAKANQIYSSPSSTIPENETAETSAKTLQRLSDKIQYGLLLGDTSTESEEALKELCSECNGVASELLQALERLKIYDRKTRWKSMRQALKSVTSKGKIDGIAQRLDRMGMQLGLGFLVELSGKIDLVAISNAESFKTLEAKTQAIITSVIEKSKEFDAVTQAQTARMTEVHEAERQILAEQHDAVMATIAATSKASKLHDAEEHTRTRHEVSELKKEAEKLKRDMEMEFAELKALIHATAEAKNNNLQRELQEKTTAASASWLAKDIIYANLISRTQDAAKVTEQQIATLEASDTVDEMGMTQAASNVGFDHTSADTRQTKSTEGVRDSLQPQIPPISSFGDLHPRPNYLPSRSASGEQMNLDLQRSLDEAILNHPLIEHGLVDVKVVKDMLRFHEKRVGGRYLPSEQLMNDWIESLYRSESQVDHASARYRNVTCVTSIEAMVASFGFREAHEQLPPSLQIAMAKRLNQWKVKELAAQRRRPFFFYGSFMFPAAVLARTRGTSLKDIANSMTPATLRGYTRHVVRAQDWPALYPASSVYSQVKGMILFDMHDNHRRIHEFQGGMFDLKKSTVEIELKNGDLAQIEVDIYVWNGDLYKLLPVSEKSWSPSEFISSPFFKAFQAASEDEEKALSREPERISKMLGEVLHKRVDHYDGI